MSESRNCLLMRSYEDIVFPGIWRISSKRLILDAGFDAQPGAPGMRQPSCYSFMSLFGRGGGAGFVRRADPLPDLFSPCSDPVLFTQETIRHQSRTKPLTCNEHRNRTPNFLHPTTTMEGGGGGGRRAESALDKRALVLLHGARE